MARAVAHFHCSALLAEPLNGQVILRADDLLHDGPFQGAPCETTFVGTAIHGGNANRVDVRLLLFFFPGLDHGTRLVARTFGIVVLPQFMIITVHDLRTSQQIGVSGIRKLSGAASFEIADMTIRAWVCWCYNGLGAGLTLELSWFASVIGTFDTAELAEDATIKSVIQSNGVHFSAGFRSPAPGIIEPVVLKIITRVQRGAVLNPITQ